ncbi:hypothetical protein BX264_7105 [Streptomyces sp. 2333.5]|uniref:hypothetical protein n=1 Tax=unclassified Streptomyces TaxID=2593676 RepID=UPI0008951692|nr:MULTISPECIES: hypothetical protein [unclassified Streptomyces]PJJ06566.1 hypothetical protein BX264_7105 [Streptomyces sp. 2333.5]SEE97000.1 hypothetical protein SAMN05428943_7204 [Streptomyces sp. 2314.4]SEF11145.1 hypothetical protein SAMN05428942_7205 [Streptomyces sp. 2112.2]
MAANPTVPPRLIGPRMAVWGYFPFDGRVVDADGTRADWDWAMRQWDRVAQAGAVVRLVVADHPYSRIDPGTAAGEARRSDARAKFAACRDAEQLVFGRVYVAGGRLGLGAVGTLLDDPLRPGHKVPAVADQINAWRSLYGDQIAGIYLDSGPVDCTDPVRPGSVPGIPANYAEYRPLVRQLGYKLFIQVAQFPDNQPPGPWLPALVADFLEVWEAGVLPYRSRFQARDACRPNANPGVPAWWDPGAALRWSRVHVVDDCRDADAMRSVAELAVHERGAGTVWITTSRQDPNLGAVFDVLPPYWDDEVAFFRAFLLKDTKDAKDVKDGKEAKEQKEVKEHKEDKEDKEEKEAKEHKEQKEEKEDQEARAKEAKEHKEEKEEKEDQEAAEAKEHKDHKDDPDNFKADKDNPDDFKINQDTKTETERKDAKDHTFEKEGEMSLKGLEVTGLTDRPMDETQAPEGAPLPLGRTFIRPVERPEVGATIVAEPVAPTNPTDPEGSRP